MKKTVLILGIIFLFVGGSVASSINARVKETPSDYNQIETIEVSKEIISGGKIAYGYNAYCPGIQVGTVCFNLDDPGNITHLQTYSGIDFLSGGTWTNDWRWLCCEYGSGVLWDVDLCNFGLSSIGGGGVGLQGLSYDPVTEKLYGASKSDLYEVNITSGEQTYIGGFGDGPSTMIGIAFDAYGFLYGWDVGTDNLWIIDTETGEASLVGPLGIDLIFAQDGAFDYETDTLYLATYTNTTGGQLHICDEDTGELTLVGDFQNGAEIDALAIPYGEDIYPPNTRIILTPKNPNGDNCWYISNVTVKLIADDASCVNATYYRINGGEWLQYESKFVISEEGDNILVEYYSVDTVGNIEDVKSKTLDIDKSLPELIIDYNVTKTGCREWTVRVTFTYKDNTSGVDRLDIYLNGWLQATITWPGPTYSWGFKIKGVGEFTFGGRVYDKAGNNVYKEILIKLSRNQLQQSTHPLFLRFLDHFPLLHRLLDIWRLNLV